MDSLPSRLVRLIDTWRTRANGYDREVAAGQDPNGVARTNALRWREAANELEAAMDGVASFLSGAAPHSAGAAAPDLPPVPKLPPGKGVP